MVSVMESLLLVNQRLGQCSQSWSISCKNSTDRIDTQQGQQLFDGWFSQVEETLPYGTYCASCGVLNGLTNHTRLEAKTLKP